MSSLLGALDTSVSGLTAQSSAFSNISDNVANSQTAGFKRTDTSFSDYLTSSTAQNNQSGFVEATPDYRNSEQGTISASTNPLAVAISGAGLFQVTQANTDGTLPTSAAERPEYTRNGDFSLNNQGYLVNSAGLALEGWSADGTGAISQNTIAPIQINQSSLSPVATSAVTLSANLPASGSSSGPVTSQVNVYDAKGTEHTVTLSWTQNATDDWTVSLSAPDASAATLGSAEVKFGNASGDGVASGTVGSLTNTTGSVNGSSYAAGGTANLSFSADFGEGPQPITLGLGTFGKATGLTQFAGTSYTLNSLTQNGVPPGSFSSVTTQSNGNVVVNYDNGQSRTVAQVPVIQFANVDGLQRQNGQAFTATSASGAALAETAGAGGAGALVTSSVEGSNVDIATEFTQLIVAQNAYSANAKLVTTADDLLQTTINMKR